MRPLELARLAAESVRRRPLRVCVTALGVAIGTGALVSMVGFALGLESVMQDSVADLQMLNQLDVQPRRDADGRDRRPLDDAAIAEIAALPGVEAAYPDLSIHEVEVSSAEASEDASAMGIPAELGRVGFLAGLLRAGRFPQQPGEAVLSSQLAGELGFGREEELLDTTVQLENTGLRRTEDGDFRPETGQVELRVVGIFRTPPIGFEFGGKVVLLPPESLRLLPGSGFDPRRLLEGGRGHRRAVV